MLEEASTITSHAHRVEIVLLQPISLILPSIDSKEENDSHIPNNTYKSFFEVQPTSLEWEECKTYTEHAACTGLMISLDKRFLASQCPTPCEKVDYTGDIFGFNGGSHLFDTNEIGIAITFNTMETEIHNEILTFDLPTFIGTAGGSLGLFIGFSFTGFVWQVLDCIMRD